MIAYQLQSDIILVNKLSENAETKSRFVELVAEHLLKFQNTVQVVASRVDNKTSIVPFFATVSAGTVSGRNKAIQSEILTGKLQDMFYELFAR